MAADELFNRELDDFKDKKHEGLLHLGSPSDKLIACGINANELTISQKVLSEHLKKHNLTTDQLKGLASSIQDPILVYKHGEKHPNIVVITDQDVNGKKLSIAVKLDMNGNVTEVSNVRSVHGKDAGLELSRLIELVEEDLSSNLRWVEKEKVQNWLIPESSETPGEPIDSELIRVAKILQNFENPQISNVKKSNSLKKHKVEGVPQVFYSNAYRAVEGIKQEKATPEQWLAMLQKNGGLKAGEDKWIGLSEWLKNSDKKSLTKQEVLQYQLPKMQAITADVVANTSNLTLAERIERLSRGESIDAPTDER